MKFFSLNQRGFSLIEMLIAAGLTGMVSLGASALMKGSVLSEKKSSVQSVIDREFAVATQVASDPERLRPFVRPQDLGSCLSKNSGVNCAAGAWATVRNMPAANGLKPNASFSMHGTDDCAASHCVAQRTMTYRWVCGASSCSGLEITINVLPVDSPIAGASQADAAAAKVIAIPRRTTITLGARQFVSRDQFAWNCESSGRTITSVNYDDVSDTCTSYANSACGTSMAQYYYANGSDCQGNVDRGCGSGFNSLTLDQNRVSCGSGAAFQ